MNAPYVDTGAVISACGRYRYRLWREWRGTHDPKHWWWMKHGDGKPVLDGAGASLGEPKACVFIMLNPSTADGNHDDATIRRCIDFARRWKYERLEVVNLFAYRATQPEVLLTLNLGAAVGPNNLETVTELVADAGLVVCAWGNHGTYLSQWDTVLGWCGNSKLYCLGVTNSGQPKHPLYLPRNTPLRLFKPKVKS